MLCFNFERKGSGPSHYCAVFFFRVTLDTEEKDIKRGKDEKRIDKERETERERKIEK